MSEPRSGARWWSGSGAPGVRQANEAGTALVAVATALMLQSMRVFVAYLIFVVDQSHRERIGIAVVATILAMALAPAVRRGAGPARAVAISVGILAGGRLVLQFWGDPQARIVLAAAVVIAWGWLMICVLGAGTPVVTGLALGLGIDLAVRVGFATVDLPWMPGAAAHAVTVLLAALLAAAWWISRRAIVSGTRSGSALPLIAIGPGLVLYHLVIGNISLAQVRLDSGYPLAAVVVAGGWAIGAGLPDTWAPPSNSRLQSPVISTLFDIVIAAGALLAFWRGEGAGLLLLLASMSSLRLLTRALGHDARIGLGRGGVTLWFVAGMLLQVALLFMYYSATGLPAIIGVAFVLLAAGALASLTRGERSPAVAAPEKQTGEAPVLTAVVTVALIVITLGTALTWSMPERGDPVGQELTVMTWNLQSGFAADNEWSLERQARVIEAQQPDIVILEEVSRGWLATTTVDEVLWLSRRLNMPYVFGAASVDGLWGNAILTRAPLDDLALHRYTTTRNLERSAMRARVATTAGDLWVVATHLDDPGSANQVRHEQVAQLIAFWNGRTPAIVAGDFNAEPDSEVLAELTGSGLRDAAGDSGGVPTSETGRRIDYILVAGEIAVDSFATVETRASDHRAVVARLRLQP